jgi:hypothetical protein
MADNETEPYGAAHVRAMLMRGLLVAYSRLVCDPIDDAKGVAFSVTTDTGQVFLVAVAEAKPHAERGPA